MNPINELSAKKNGQLSLRLAGRLEPEFWHWVVSSSQGHLFIDPVNQDNWEAAYRLARCLLLDWAFAQGVSL